MRRKTLSIVLDAFIVLLLVTIVFLIVLIVKRGEAPIQAQETQVEETPVVQTEPTVADTEEEPEESEPEPQKDLLGRSNTDGVNIRSGAGTDHDVLGMAALGDEYKVISSHANGWIEIEYKGSTGYIFGEYLDFYYMSGGEYTPVERSEVPMAD